MGARVGFNDFRPSKSIPASGFDTRSENCSREPLKNPPQSMVSQSGLTCIEICSGAGGQAIGLERAGKKCRVRSEKRAFDVVEGDVGGLPAEGFKGMDLLAGGVTCPPFSKV